MCMYVVAMLCSVLQSSKTMEGATKFATNKRKGFAFLLKNGEWTKKQLHGNKLHVLLITLEIPAHE